MPKRRMNQDRVQESDSGLARTGRCLKGSLVDCWDCLSNSCVRIWECLTETWFDLADWTNDTCCRGREESRDVEPSAKYKDISTKSMDTMAKGKITQSNPTNTLPPTSQYPAQTLAEPELARAKPKSPQITSSSVQPRVGEPSFINVTKHVGNNPAAQLSAKPLAEYQTDNQPVPEPPKIEFVETGSIFGDRKRPTYDQNMLQIENGRFRSPGLSKTIQGPGGRTIRVSFVSGFPPIKSIESSKSLIQASGRASKRSVDSFENMSQGPGSLDFMSKKSLIHFKSSRSFKSGNSTDSK